jgi:hypothetical protein
MGWWTNLFGRKIEPDSVPAGPVIAFPFGCAEFGKRIVVRFAYSPSPKHWSDAPAVHRSLLRALPDARFRKDCLDRDFSRFATLCERVPDRLTGGVPVWIRDVGFRASEVPPKTAGDFFPYWLRFESARDIRLVIRPAETPGGRAKQRLDLARSRKAVPVRTALVMANADLFAAGPKDLPCRVLFTFDDRVSDDELTDLAGRTCDLKYTSPPERDRAFVAELTTDETFYYYRRDRLPRSFAGRQDVFVASLHIHRPFLPDGYIIDRILPCLAEPGESGMLELLPFSEW